MRVYTRKGQLYAEYEDEGKRMRKSLKLKDTEENRAKAIAQLEARVQAARSKTKFIDPLEVPLKETVIEFLERFKGYKQSSQHTLQKRLRTIVKLLGIEESLPTNSLNIAHMKCYYQGVLEANYNTNTLYNLNVLLKSFLEFAFDRGYLTKNPYYKQKILIAPKPKSNTVLSLDQVLEILRECDQPFLKTYLAIGFFSGLRVGEILALCWGDFDFEKHTISVTKTFNEDGQLTPPKTASSVRTINMLACVEKQVKAFSLFFDVLNKETPLFGRNLKLQAIISKKWAKLLELLEIPHIKLYSTRHTFASIMLERGEEPLWVSWMLGHKNLNITLKVYAKYIPQQHKQRATFLEGVEL